MAAVKISRTNCSSLASHSQIRLTFQPRDSSARRFWASRSTFRRNFSSQKATFDFGMEAFRHSGCLCQKQPSTNTASLRRGITRSGVPGKSRRWMRKRSPIECAVRRTIISGLVSLDFTRDISRDRRSGESRSTTIYSAATECVRASRDRQISVMMAAARMGGTLLPIILKLCQIVGWNTWQSGNPCRRAASLTVITRG